MVTLATHASHRTLIATANSTDMKSILSNYDISQDLDYETPPGQRPTLSSYLLWVARQKNIPGASIWVPIPFYLLSVDDPRARRKTIDFINNRFSLGIDLADIDEEIHQQNTLIAQIANQFPELDELLHKLESNVSLTEEENNRMIQLVSEHIGKAG
jgi:predicted ATP-grasp superfamily ATP-dependent carboligase